MFRITKMLATTVLVVIAALIFSMACMGAGDVQRDTKTGTPVLDQCIRQLRTEALREKAKEYGALLQSDDPDKRNEAIDFFHDPRASAVLFEFGALRHRYPQVCPNRH